MDAALERLRDQVRAAQADRTSLTIRGSGSKDFLGGPLQGDLLDTQTLSGISSYEPTELVITARAGTPLADIEAALAERGQFLAFEPPRHGPQGTVGGMVASGLAGPARASAGAVRDFILGASLLNGQAEVLSFGGQVMKNVAGYDVSRLLAGSMGILGVILEVSIKVMPVPPAELTLRFDMAEDQALLQLARWGGQPLPLNASAWWDGVLVVRLSGARAAVEAAHRKMGGEIIDAAMAQAFWGQLRDQRDEFFSQALRTVQEAGHLWRASVPQTAAPLGVPGDTLIEWAGAQRWMAIADGDTARETAWVKAARAAGGSAHIYRGPRSGAALELDPVTLRLHRQLKAAFDPLGLFNPGRLHPDL